MTRDWWEQEFAKLYPWRGTMPIIEISGSPFRMGQSLGRQTSPLIRLVADAFIDWLCREIGLSKDRVLEEAHKYESEIVTQIGHDYIEEMRGIADGAGIPYEDVLIINCGWDLLNSLPTPETHPDYMCSALCVWGSATRNGNVICGHNDDGTRYIDQFLVFVRARPNSGYELAVPLVPGYLGYHRMWNNQGVVVLGLALEKGPRNSEFRYSVPMWVLLRHVVQWSASSRDALDILTAHPPGTAFHFLITDRSGDTLVVEVSGKHIDVLEPASQENWLVVTNHALSTALRQFLIPRESPSSTHYRYQTVQNLLRQHLGKVDRNIVKDILSSHYDASLGRIFPSLNSPCRHGEYAGKLSGTVSTVIIEIADNEVIADVSLGNPCENRWISITMPLRA